MIILQESQFKEWHFVVYHSIDCHVMINQRQSRVAIRTVHHLSWMHGFSEPHYWGVYC